MRRSWYGVTAAAMTLVAILGGMAGSTRLADAISRPPPPPAAPIRVR